MHNPVCTLTSRVALVLLACSTEHAQLSEGSAAGSGDEGPQPKSTGADLAELLEQSQLQYSQAYYRHRGMQQELVAELPPGLDSQQVRKL